MAGRITDMVEAVADGSEWVETSKPSSTVTITASTISAAASDNSYNDSGNGFVSAGFAEGDRINVAGFTGDTANNIFVGTIETLAAGKMTIASPEGDVIVNDSAGESVMITKWESQRSLLAASGGGGLNWKLQCRVATTTAGTLASDFEDGDTVDSVTLATGDRILIKNQASASENGIYAVQASGAPARVSDADTGAELVAAAVFITAGTSNADTSWACITKSPIVPDTTDLLFARVVAGSLAVRGALVKLNANLTGIDATGGGYKVSWDAEEYDTDIIHDNSTNNSRLTVPAGCSFVRLVGGLRIANATAADLLALNPLKNGMAFTASPFLQWIYGTSGPCMSFSSAIIPVSPGDYFELSLTVSSDASIQITASFNSYFGMEIIG